MFGKLKLLLRRNDTKKMWNPPSYWQNELHMSTYERQQRQAAQHRERIARDTGIY